MKIEAEQKRPIFENIAKIYERAYGAGHDIVIDTKNHSEQLLANMLGLFTDASHNTDKALTKQSELKQAISSTYEKLNLLIKELSENTDTLFNNAQSYVSVFDSFKQIKSDVEKQSEEQLKEFEAFASEFLTEDEIKKAPPKVYNVEADKKDVVVTAEAEESKEKAEAPAETVIAAPSKEIIEEAALETSDSATSDTELATAPSKEQPTENKAEFTQFGRKSKFSSADRDELVRKALLKNGGL